MRRLALVLLIHVIMACPSLVARTVTVAVFDGASPLVFVAPDGRATGFYPEILRRMLHDIGHSPEFVTGLTFSEAYQRVVDGEIDLLPGVTRTRERERVLRFTDTPLLIAWSEVYVRPGVEVDTVFDLRGARVGVLSGGQNGANFVALMDSFDLPFERVEFHDFHELTDAVLDRSVDAGVYFSFYHLGDQRLSPTSIVFSPSDASVTTAVNGSVDVIEQLNDRLEELKADPKSYYYDLLDEWLLQSTRFATPVWALTLGVGLLVGVLVALTFVVLLRRQEVRIREKLRRSESRAQALFEVQRDMVAVYGAEYGEESTLLEVNAETCRRLGYSREELIGSDPRRLVDEADADKLVALQAVIRESGQALIPLHLRARDGSLLETEIMATRYHTGNVQYTIGVGRDISARLAIERELREAVAEKEALIREIQHRVRNNIQTIAALVNTQLMIATDPGVTGELTKTANRIHALGLLHRMVYQSGRTTVIPLNEYVRALASHLSESASRPGHRIEFEVEVPQIEIDMDLALPLGLFLNEALTNAILHAFGDGDSGTVRVVVTARGDHVETVDVADNGVGLADTSVTDPGGLGFRMMRMLGQQLHGELHVSGENGVRLQLRIPKEKR